MSDHTIIVISDPADPRLAMLDALPPGTSITVGERAEAFEQAAEEADVILNWAFQSETLKEILGRCPRLRWIHCRAAGLDHLLFPELVESPVELTNARGVFSQSLGEFALGAMLHFAKGFRAMVRNQEAGVWAPFDVEEIAGRTVGIVGYGDIGRAVAERARAMGMRVLALKRHAPPDGSADAFAERVFGPEGRMEVLARADYVVVATPITPETRGLIGEAEFAAMKPGAVIVNVGRGAAIDEAALIRALTERRIKGAALDVFECEPLPEGHPLYRLDNVLLSPHCADHTATWIDDAMRFFLTQFERYCKGEPLLNVVDKRLGY